MYPLYWTQESDVFWLETGGPIINACLIVRDFVVEFKFCDGSQSYSRKREFSSPSRAKNFAIKFGRLMRKLDRLERVPVPATFEKF